MAHNRQPGRPQDPQKTRRDERLAEALRENLRRRKAQLRGRERGATDEPPEQEPGGAC